MNNKYNFWWKQDRAWKYRWWNTHANPFEYTKKVIDFHSRLYFEKATLIQENKSNFHFSKYIFEKFLVSTHHFFQAALGGGLSFHLDLRFFFMSWSWWLMKRSCVMSYFFFNLCQVCNGRYTFGDAIARNPSRPTTPPSPWEENSLLWVMSKSYLIWIMAFN